MGLVAVLLFSADPLRRRLTVDASDPLPQFFLGCCVLMDFFFAHTSRRGERGRLWGGL
jgi:hypothetical protein